MHARAPFFSSYRSRPGTAVRYRPRLVPRTDDEPPSLADLPRPHGRAGRTRGRSERNRWRTRAQVTRPTRRSAATRPLAGMHARAPPLIRTSCARFVRKIACMRACSFFLLFSRGQQLISRSLNINFVAIDLKGCSWHICMHALCLPPARARARSN
jgi:hypothetical protein